MSSGDQTESYYRRNLPHYQPEGVIFFVTFRLARSLPQNVVRQLREEHKHAKDIFLKQAQSKQNTNELNILQKKYFAKFDALLDSSKSGDHWLSNPDVAKPVSDAIRYRDGKQYNLICYCLMPNHVHIVFKPLQALIVDRPDWSRYTVSKIMENLKWYTALHANRILNRKGQFWQHESYDHVVRDGKELERIIYYVLNNPVKAGLVQSWEDWQWSYVKDEVL